MLSFSLPRSTSHNASTATLLSVHSDQNILFHSLRSATISRQVIGYNDEIIDSVFLTPPTSAEASTSKRDTSIAFATNSSLIRVYSTSTYDARLLAGHSDMVLCLDRSKDGQWLVSGSKDRTARVWACLPPAAGGEPSWRCIAVCEGHAESIGAVAVSRKPMADESLARAGIRAGFLFTASQDRTIKMWDLTAIDLSAAEPTKLRSLLTQKIHEKDINSLDISPNNRLLATGSQDKTVKVFDVSFTPGKKGAKSAGAVNQLGTCKGHKRGIWSVKFSKTDKVLATASGDKTVRVWSLDDFSCLKVRAKLSWPRCSPFAMLMSCCSRLQTFEGHSNSVLRVDFMTQGQQLVSSSSDGLVKIWNIKDEECAASLDNHEDKIWALAISEDEQTIVSGAADSVVTFWSDCTQTDEREKVNKLESTILKYVLRD
jgi:U3 small nucleolar RNA-associated protein 13